MYLEKENVSLYYEVHGEGDPLILIHGVIVDADLYRETAKLLSKYYKVILYDRRGNSRSRCAGEICFSMEDQIEDIKDLMDALHTESAYIVGVSAGGVIGQYFLQRYPECVKHLIAYEAAMLGVMMDDENLRTWTEEMKQTVAKRRFSTALLRFSQHIGPMDERAPQKPLEVSKREMGNYEFALTQEFPGMAAYQPDLEKMRDLSDKITFAAGERSMAEHTVYARASVRLAGEIGKKPVYYPGGHNLPFELPAEFAVCVLGTLMLL